MQITIDTTNIESVATAIREGITTPDQLAYWMTTAKSSTAATSHLARRSTPTMATPRLSTPAKWPRAKLLIYMWRWRRLGERDRTTWVTVYTYRKGVDGDGKIQAC